MTQMGLCLPNLGRKKQFLSLPYEGLSPCICHVQVWFKQNTARQKEAEPRLAGSGVLKELPAHLFRGR